MSERIHPGTIEDDKPEEILLDEDDEESGDVIHPDPISAGQGIILTGRGAGGGFETRQASLSQHDAIKEGRYKTLEFTSENAGLGLDLTDIGVKYCSLCAIPLFISDAPWDVLPRRPEDNSLIFETAKWMKKFLITSYNKNPIVIKRDRGAEIQYRFICTECEVPVGYTSEVLTFDGKKKEPSHYYIFDGCFVEKPHESEFAKNC
eukprot:GHVH01011602.1.p1 GENE.GHVH01011602.1~~GHVH01011602.1.p1  ORF type:complete len:205 (+),score=27.62 GHVH01011602.1:482-1096(+)